VASQIALILSVVNNGLNQAWIPFVYSNASKEEFESLFVKHVRHLILFVATIGSWILLFSKELLTLMGKVEYLDARNVLPILLFAYGFQILYFCYVALILYQKNTKLMPVITILTGLVCILLNLFLVPIWGQYGAALATLISFLLMAWLAVLVSRKSLRVQILNRSILIFFAGAAAILIISARFIDPLDLAIRIPLKGCAALGFVILLRWLDLLRPKDFLLSLLKRGLS
jgi:O-antigen/teichoic acid export membrane protein